MRRPANQQIRGEVTGHGAQQGQYARLWNGARGASGKEPVRTARNVRDAPTQAKLQRWTEDRLKLSRGGGVEDKLGDQVVSLS